MAGACELVRLVGQSARCKCGWSYSLDEQNMDWPARRRQDELLDMYNLHRKKK